MKFITDVFTCVSPFVPRVVNLRGFPQLVTLIRVMCTVRGAVSKADEEQVVDTEDTCPAVKVNHPPRTATNDEAADLLVWDKYGYGNGAGSFNAHILSVTLTNMERYLQSCVLCPLPLPICLSPYRT